jgi:hypothetical protein
MLLRMLLRMLLCALLRMLPAGQPPEVAGELGPAHVEPALPLNPQNRNPI